MAGKVKKAAGFVIFRKINNEINYLLLQTSYGEHHWTPPKGHVDPGETEYVTAERETLEESGLKINDLEVFKDDKYVLNYNVKGHLKTVTYWLARLINRNAEVKLSDEHQDFKWLNIQDARSYVKYSDTQQMLEYFDDHIKTKL